MAEETRSEQLAQKVTPSVREKLDEVLKRWGIMTLARMVTLNGIRKCLRKSLLSLKKNILWMVMIITRR